MTARIRKLLNDLGETFWLVPAAMVVVGISLAVGLVELDRSGLVPAWLIESSWLYNGGGTGARTLLGAVASSTIGVAGTVFSITIAALSLAAGQMGPRLLRNFARDRGNQVTLGAFLGTFSYALMVLRSVRTQSEGAFIPHLSLSIGILLAFVCVATLVYFVGHMAGASTSTRSSISSARIAVCDQRLTPRNRAYSASAARSGESGYSTSGVVIFSSSTRGLADWAARMDGDPALVRPGDYVFPGATIAFARHPSRSRAAIRAATALGAQRESSADLEFAVRQLVEVAVRALSPGINDPHTAVSVLDRLGALM